MSAGVDAGSEAALEEVAERLGVALADHGCRGTPACEGLSGATKVRAAFAAKSSTSRSFPVMFCVSSKDALSDCVCPLARAPPRHQGVRGLHRQISTSVCVQPCLGRSVACSADALPSCMVKFLCMMNGPRARGTAIK